MQSYRGVWIQTDSVELLIDSSPWQLSRVSAVFHAMLFIFYVFLSIFNAGVRTQFLDNVAMRDLY